MLNSIGFEDFDYDDIIEIEEEHKEEDDEGDMLHTLSFQPVDAFQMNPNEVMTQLQQRGITARGFHSDDAHTLQEYLDKEHAEYIARQRHERAQKKVLLKKQAVLQKRKLIMEDLQREEIIAMQNDHRIENWVHMLKNNVTEIQARIPVNSVTARLVAKTLCSNSSLVRLDLSRCQLDDLAGTFLGKSLEKNSSLEKMELESNQFGPKTCKAFSNALITNRALVFLGFESNPLTSDGLDNSGILSLSEMLRRNKSLTYLNLASCGLHSEAGSILSRHLHENSGIVFMDITRNSLNPEDERRIIEKLEENRSLLAGIKQNIKRENEIRAMKEEKEQALQAELRKQRETTEWLEDQRLLRAQARLKATMDLAAQRKAEQDEILRLREKKAEKERRAKELADAKKKKKKGKKGKKKVSHHSRR